MPDIRNDYHDSPESEEEMAMEKTELMEELSSVELQCERLRKYCLELNNYCDQLERVMKDHLQQIEFQWTFSQERRPYQDADRILDSVLRTMNLLWDALRRDLGKLHRPSFPEQLEPTDD